MTISTITTSTTSTPTTDMIEDEPSMLSTVVDRTKSIITTVGQNPIEIVSDDSSDGDFGRVIASTHTATTTTTSTTTKKNPCRTTVPGAPVTVKCGEDKNRSDVSTLMMKKKTKDDPTTDASALRDDTSSVPPPVSSVRKAIAKPKPLVITVTEEAIRNIQKEHWKQLQESKATTSKMMADITSQRHDGITSPFHPRLPTTTSSTTPGTIPPNASMLQLFPSHLRSEYVQLQQQYHANQLQQSNVEYMNMLQLYQQHQPQQLLYDQQQYGPSQALSHSSSNSLYYGDTYHQRIMSMTAPAQNMMLVQKPKPTRRRRRCNSKSLPSTTPKKGRTTGTTKDATQILRTLSKHDVTTAVQCLRLPSSSTTANKKYHPPIQLILPPSPITKKCDKNKPVRIEPKPKPPPSSSYMLSDTPRHQKGVRFSNIPILLKTVLSPHLKHTPPATSPWNSIPTGSTINGTPTPIPIPIPPLPSQFIQESTALTSLIYEQPTPTQTSDDSKLTNDCCHHSKTNPDLPTKGVTPIRHIAVVSPPNCSGDSYYDDHPIDDNDYVDDHTLQHEVSCRYGTKSIPDESSAATNTNIHSNATSAFSLYTTVLPDDANHNDVNDWNKDDSYTDLLCLEEILSLSDSHHSHQSCMTQQSSPDATSDDMWCDTWGNEGTTSSII